MAGAAPKKPSGRSGRDPNRWHHPSMDAARLQRRRHLAEQPARRPRQGSRHYQLRGNPPALRTGGRPALDRNPAVRGKERPSPEAGPKGTNRRPLPPGPRRSVRQTLRFNFSAGLRNNRRGTGHRSESCHPSRLSGFPFSARHRGPADGWKPEAGQPV